MGQSDKGKPNIKNRDRKISNFGHFFYIFRPFLPNQYPPMLYVDNANANIYAILGDFGSHVREKERAYAFNVQQIPYIASSYCL